MDGASGIAESVTAEPVAEPASFSFVRLWPGDRMVAFFGRTSSRERFAPDTMAGRYQVFCTFLTGSDPMGRSAIDAIHRERSRFDDQFASIFGVGIDAKDEPICVDQFPGVRFFRDYDRAISRQIGALPKEVGGSGQGEPAKRMWIVVDPMLYVAAVFPFDMNEDPEHRAVFRYLEGLAKPDEYGIPEKPAPVIVIPNVIEPAICRQLIGLYDADGGAPSGFVRENAFQIDSGFKVRSDFTIPDEALVNSLKVRLSRRVMPEIKRLFFMDITRVERQIVACYGAEDGGHFRPHRDNNPGITEHRRFAVSINLNDDFEGGEVCFPEYRKQGLKVPAGWAVVFPCAVLHTVNVVRSGKRYAYLPFLYDEAGAALRKQHDGLLQKALADLEDAKAQA